MTIENDQLQQMQQHDIVYQLTGDTHQILAARASGLYRSTDHGQNWDDLFASLDDDLVVTAVGAHHNEIFAGTKGGVLRSSDGGDNWFTSAFPPPAPLVSSLLLSPDYERDGTLIATTAEDGIFVSNDRGVRWMPWNFGLLDLNTYCSAFSPHFADDQTILIGTESGIFRSKNGGRAWRAIPFSMDLAPVISIGLRPSSASTYQIVAGTEEHGLYQSDDQGQTWSQLGADRIQGAVNALTINAGNMREIWSLLDHCLLQSHDSGESWTQVGATFKEEQLPTTVYISSDSALDPLVGFVDGTIQGIK